MSNCSDFENWDSLTQEGRLDALETLINDSLQEQGYDPVNVEVGDLEGYAGSTDSDGTITIDAESLDSEGAEYNVDTAFHEVEHAKQYQDGEDYGPLDEIDAWDAGAAGAIEWKEECDPDPESGAGDGGGNGGDIELELVPIPPDGIEFDWDEMGEGWEMPQ